MKVFRLNFGLKPILQLQAIDVIIGRHSTSAALAGGLELNSNDKIDFSFENYRR